MYPYNHKMGQKIQTNVDGAVCDRAFLAHFQVAADDAVAADADGIHAAITASAEEVTEVDTEITDPAVPRNITATAGGTAGDIKAVQVTVTGLNFADEEISEDLPAFTEDTAGTVTGSKAFKSVTGISIPAMDGAGVTVTVGFGEKLGLPYKLVHDTVMAAYLDNAKEGTAPTVAVDADSVEGNTMKLNSSLAGKVVDAYLLV